MTGVATVMPDDAGAETTREGAQVAGRGVPVVDVFFDIAGTRVPADYAAALARAVAQVLPWFEADPRAGIHALRAAPSTHGQLVLARRAKLALRVPASAVSASLALTGQVLAIAGEAIVVGEGSARPLAPSATLFAQRVVTGAPDERAFHDDVVQWLQDLGVRCEFISGKARSTRVGDRQITGYGLALHGLAPADSLLVQGEGMGTERRLGCGIFVPHKAIATPT